MTRGIGTLGTALRALTGAVLLAVALVSGLEIHDAVLGLVALPAAMLAFVLVVRRYVDGPLRFTGPVGLSLNGAVIVGLVAFAYTRDAAALFYGMSLLAAARSGLPGCEATVLSNALLRRDDQIGCPTFSPIDAAEARLRRRRETSSASIPWPVVTHVVGCVGFGAIVVALSFVL